MSTENLKRLQEMVAKDASQPEVAGPQRGDAGMMSTLRAGDSWLQQSVEHEKQVQAQAQQIAALQAVQSEEARKAQAEERAAELTTMRWETRRDACWQEFVFRGLGAALAGALALIVMNWMGRSGAKRRKKKARKQQRKMQLREVVSHGGT